MITSTALTMRFGDTVALNHLTLAVQPGEIYCLLGPRGSGKSTAVNLFMGFLKPAFGTASIEGYDVTKYPNEVKKRTALVTAHTPLYDRLTPIQHMEMFASMYNRHDQHQSSIVERLRAAGLPERAMSERVFQGGQDRTHAMTILATAQSNTPAARFDFQKPYVEAWLGFVGVTDVHAVIVEKTILGEDVDRSARDAAVQQARVLADRLCR